MTFAPVKFWTFFDGEIKIRFCGLNVDFSSKVGVLFDDCSCGYFDQIFTFV